MAPQQEVKPGSLVRFAEKPAIDSQTGNRIEGMMTVRAFSVAGEVRQNLPVGMSTEEKKRILTTRFNTEFPGRGEATRRQEGGATLFSGGRFHPEMPGLGPGFLAGTDPSPLASAALEVGPTELAKQILWTQPKESASRAIEAFKSGDPWQAVARDVLGAVPILGPGGLHMGERVAPDPVTGETDIMGAIGEGAAMFIPWGARKFGSLNIPPKPRTTLLPQTFGQRTGSRRLKGMEEVARGIPGAAGVFRRFDQFVNSEALRIANETIESVSKRALQADEGTFFHRFNQFLESATERLRRPASKIYKKIDESVATRTVTKQEPYTTPGRTLDAEGNLVSVQKTRPVSSRVSDVMPETRTLKELAQPLLDRLTDEGHLLSAADLQSTRSTLQKIVDSPDSLPFLAFQDARSSFLKAARKIDDNLPGKKAKVVGDLAKVTDKAMRDALIKGGRQDLLNQLEIANRIWREASEVLGDKAFRKLLEADPAATSAVLAGTPTHIIEALRAKNIIPDDVMAEAAGIVLRDELFGPATTGQLPVATMERFGVTDAGRGAGRALSAERLGLGIERMKSQLEVLVGPKAAKQIVELTADLFELRRSSEAGQSAARLVAAGAIAGPLAAFFLKAVGGEVTAGLIRGGMTAGIMMKSAQLFARAVTTNGATRLALQKFIDAVGSGKTQQAVFWAQRANESVRHMEIGAGTQRPGLLGSGEPPPGMAPESLRMIPPGGEQRLGGRGGMVRSDPLQLNRDELVQGLQRPGPLG
jgi:hypothetical protein